VIVPITGAAGVMGCASITAFNDATDVHPLALVTVNVYVAPASKPVTVPVVPVPVKVPDGVPVTVQLPVDGKPLKDTLPVATVHVGWVIVPITGVVGNPLIVYKVLIDSQPQLCNFKIIEVVAVEVLTVTVLVIVFQLVTKEGFPAATIGE
jgi:hypothetical protein